jgi:Domain of unknown function (DUF4926)
MGDIQLLQVVRLVKGFPEAGVPAGAEAVVVLLYDGAFEVEVVDEAGRTVYTGSVGRDDIEPVV